MQEKVVLPEISETVTSGQVVEVFVQVGQQVKADQPLAQLETEKATFDVPSPKAGIIQQILIQPGQKISVGQAMFVIETDLSAARPAAPAVQPDKSTAVPSSAFSAVAGSAKPAAPASTPAPASAPSAAPAAPTETPPSAGSLVAASRPLPDLSVFGPVERKAASPLRKKIADALTHTWATVPQVTQFDQADVTELEKYRKDSAAKVQQAGGKLTVTAIVLKALATVLREPAFAVFNASYDAQTKEIVYRKYYHIAVAVDTDKGLMVPVIRDVDKKSLLQIAVELTALSQRTQENQLKPDDLLGGTFTVSNLGGLGGGAFTPILNWPQAAILGIGQARQTPTVVEGSIQIRLMMPLCLSYDHRIIDGADSVRFLRRLIAVLQNPLELVLE